MNSKGNLAFNLLPIIALVMCAGALFAFINLDDKFGAKSAELGQIASDLSIMRQYIETSAEVIMYDFVNNGFTPQDLQESAARHNLHLQGQGNFFLKIEEGDFIINRNGESIVLEVPGVFIQSRHGSNFGQSEFDLKIEADNNGQFIRFINK